MVSDVAEPTAKETLNQFCKGPKRLKDVFRLMKGEEPIAPDIFADEANSIRADAQIALGVALRAATMQQLVFGSAPAKSEAALGSMLSVVLNSTLQCDASKNLLSNVRQYDVSGTLLNSVQQSSAEAASTSIAIPARELGDAHGEKASPQSNTGSTLPRTSPQRDVSTSYRHAASNEGGKQGQQRRQTNAANESLKMAGVVEQQYMMLDFTARKPDFSVVCRYKGDRRGEHVTIELKLHNLKREDVRQAICQGMAAVTSNAKEGSQHRTRSLLINQSYMMVFEFQLDEGFAEELVAAGTSLKYLPAASIKGTYKTLYAGPCDFRIGGGPARQVLIGLMVPSLRYHENRGLVRTHLQEISELRVQRALQEFSFDIMERGELKLPEPFGPTSPEGRMTMLAALLTSTANEGLGLPDSEPAGTHFLSSNIRRKRVLASGKDVATKLPKIHEASDISDISEGKVKETSGKETVNGDIAKGGKTAAGANAEAGSLEVAPESETLDDRNALDVTNNRLWAREWAQKKARIASGVASLLDEL